MVQVQRLDFRICVSGACLRSQIGVHIPPCSVTTNDPSVISLDAQSATLLPEFVTEAGNNASLSLYLFIHSFDLTLIRESAPFSQSVVGLVRCISQLQ
jgi:hypothetical protein